MKQNDWVDTLADAIQEGYGVDSSVESARLNLRRTILEVIPFKPEVLYMPVPRCDQCLHWKRTNDILKLGHCLLLVHGNYGREFVRKAVADSGTERADFLTQDSFGCVQWKEKV